MKKTNPWAVFYRKGGIEYSMDGRLRIYETKPEAERWLYSMPDYRGYSIREIQILVPITPKRGGRRE